MRVRHQTGCRTLSGVLSQKDESPASFISKTFVNPRVFSLFDATMAKAKGHPGVQNKVIYSRASYLYQAANYLASQAHEAHQKATELRTDEHSACTTKDKEAKALRNLSRLAVFDMRTVSLKTQIRLTPELKRTACKFCNMLQIEGQTCRSTIENLSKGGMKPWADVLVVRCNTCNNSKRFPVNAPRQKRRQLRTPATPATTATETESIEPKVTEDNTAGSNSAT